jgi:hypothetical protein
MPDLDPQPVLAALDTDDRLRPFIRDGRIDVMPARRARRLLLLDAVAQAFEPGRRYPERQVSLFLGALHPDYAALRRYLVDDEFLSRSGGEYWRSGGSTAPAAGPGEPAPGQCDDDGMADNWARAAVADVQPGDRVRLASGKEMFVTRIEHNFFGRDNMVAFIEDTPERWFKQPVQRAAELEVLRAVEGV